MSNLPLKCQVFSNEAQFLKPCLWGVAPQIQECSSCSHFSQCKTKMLVQDPGNSNDPCENWIDRIAHTLICGVFLGRSICHNQGSTNHQENVTKCCQVQVLNRSLQFQFTFSACEGLSLRRHWEKMPKVPKSYRWSAGSDDLYISSLWTGAEFGSTWDFAKDELGMARW